MKKRQTILILDDEENIIQALGKEVQKQGHAVVVCLHPQEALHRITKTPVDLVISDLRMPAMHGIDFLIKVRETCSNAARILLITPEDRELAVASVAQGAADWVLEKPWEEEMLKLTLIQTLRYQQMLRENRILQSLLKDEKEYSDELAFHM